MGSTSGSASPSSCKAFDVGQRSTLQRFVSPVVDHCDHVEDRRQVDLRNGGASELKRGLDPLHLRLEKRKP